MPLNKQAIREEFRKLNHCGSLQVIEDFFISIIEKNEKELVERIDKSRKRTVSKEHYPQITENKIHDREIYNQAIDDVLNIIKNNKD